MPGLTEAPDIGAIVTKTSEIVVQRTIDIPRIIEIPKGEVRSGFHPFSLDLTTLNYPAPSEELWIQHLRTSQLEIVGLGKGGIEEKRPEDYVVSGLVDFDDISYDEHADFLYDLAGQVISHFRTYLDEDDIRKVLRLYQREIARFVYAQMMQHFWEETDGGYEAIVSRGFTALRESAYNVSKDEPLLNYQHSPSDKSNMAKYYFGGFSRCLYNVQKFQSDSERKLAVILERDSLKWFKPAKGQFQMFYRWGSDQLEYQPDFVAETETAIYMLEPKMRSEMNAPDVLAKKDVAVRWCKDATDHMQKNGGKPWSYALIPHDVIADNMTLEGLVEKFQCKE